MNGFLSLQNDIDTLEENISLDLTRVKKYLNLVLNQEISLVDELTKDESLGFKFSWVERLLAQRQHLGRLMEEQREKERMMEEGELDQEDKSKEDDEDA